MARAIAGRAHYPTPPGVGTIVGPNTFGEHLVVIAVEDGVTLLGYATTDEVTASLQRDPQSVTEARMR